MLGGCHVKPEQFFNLIFGYYDTYAEEAVNLSTPAGSKTFDLQTVPSDEIWVIDYIGAVNINTNPTYIVFYDRVGAIDRVILRKKAPGIDVTVERFDWVVLAPSHNIRVLIGGCALNDDTYCWAHGFKMKVSQ